MRSRSIPFWISAFIHFVVIGAAAILFIKPPEFAMNAGHDSVEINLVAAAPDPVSQPPPPPITEPQEPIETEPSKPDDITVPITPSVPPISIPIPPKEPPPPIQILHPPVPAPPKSHHTSTIAKGDGSSHKPGKDAVTASSDGGAIINSRPDYLSNPPPVYPESSRREKQEGVVVLEVIVSAQGRPDTISIQTSSGFDPLDQSAVTAVRSWRFRPAALGSINVKSRVFIPVRFRLDD